MSADRYLAQLNIGRLRYLIDEYHGNLTLALAAYNGGESNVDRWLAGMRRLRDRTYGAQRQG